MTFNDAASLQFDFNNFTTAAGVINAINALNYPPGNLGTAVRCRYL